MIRTARLDLENVTAGQEYDVEVWPDHPNLVDYIGDDGVLTTTYSHVFTRVETIRHAKQGCHFELSVQDEVR